MSDRYKPPRKQLPKRSLLPEPSGDSSTDDEANKGERKSPFKALRVRARSYGTRDNEENKVAREVPLRLPFMRPSVRELSTDEDDFAESDSSSLDSDLTRSEELEVTPNNSSGAENDEDDSADSKSTSSEELEVTPNNITDANHEPPNKKRRHRRKNFTPRRIIPPEAEVNQIDAKPSTSGGSKKTSID